MMKIKKAVSPLTGGLSFWDNIQYRKEKKCDKSIPEQKYFGLNPKQSTLTIEEKVQAALGVCEECIKPEELRKLFESNPHPICYDGFEPSGNMHIAQALLKAHIVNTLTRCGCIFVFWVADWFAMLNNKQGGDLNKIKEFGKQFIKIWKVIGMDMSNVVFLWASEEINKNPDNYWTQVMDIARLNTISRLKRCCQIMGRTENDDQPGSSILYPCMQCSDIFYLKADICQLGMDQRKVNMLAREYAAQKKLKVPIILSHKMLPGLLKDTEKMSKSIPNSAIFVNDSPQTIKSKIKQAYCPPQTLEPNPCVSYVDDIIFPLQKQFFVERKESDGGNITYTSIETFHEDYLSGKLHPGDVKANIANSLIQLLKPIHDIL